MLKFQIRTNLNSGQNRKKWLGPSRFGGSTVASFGFGFMDYGRIGFMSIDILRWSMMLSQSAQSEILWETWSSPEINRYEDLQDNIQTRKEDWHDTLDSPSTLLITVGLFF